MERETRTVEEMLREGLSIKFYQRDFDTRKCDSAFPDDLDYKHILQMEQQDLSDMLKNYLEMLTNGDKVKSVFFKYYDGFLITLENDEVVKIDKDIAIKTFKKYLRQTSYGKTIFKLHITKIAEHYEMYYADLGSNIRAVGTGEFLLEPIFWIIRNIWVERAED